MKRRDRLTGFLIIFMLLIFSAYSSSMNMGGSSFNSNLKTNSLARSNNYQKKTTLTNNFPNRSKDNQIKEEKEIKAKATDLQRNNSLKVKNGENRENKKITDQERSFDSINQIRKENKEKNIKREIKKKKRVPLIDRVKVHKVKSGETLWDIASKHSLNIDSLIGANNISNMNSIKPGQEFKILPIKGVIYRVSPGESVDSIAQKFDIKAETIMKDNNLKDSANLKIDQNLLLRGAKPEFSYQDRLEKKFMAPINTRITSYYGPRWGRVHEGLDFSAPMGTPIRAASSGRVVYSGWAGGYGYAVIIEHQKGLRTLYAHNSKLLVKSGESVGKGEVISRSGNTGNSTGPHLHFEVQVNGRPENPLNYINK